ncbi:MAG: hypothetical protein ABJ000_04800 [Saccharospirillum sp.]|uniref:hypothetical protein n=1 Tax=Saccharospirillum sp. TaxID=2033801 RepID=UPI003299FB4D
MTSHYESGQDSAFDEGFDPLFREDAFFAGTKPTDSLQPEAPLQSKPSGCHAIRWYDLPQPVRQFLQRPEHRRFCWQASAQTARAWQQASPNEHRLFIAWDGVRAESVTQYRQGLHSHRSVYAFRTNLPAQSTAVSSGSGTADKSASLPSRFGGGAAVEGGVEHNASVRIVQPEPGAQLRQEQRPIRQTRERYRLANDETWWDLAHELYGVPHATPLANLNHPDYTLSQPPEPGQELWVPGTPVLAVTGTGSYGRAVRVHWQGPTQGEQSVPLNRDQADVDWSLDIPVSAGEYQLHASNRDAEHPLNITVLPPDPVPLALEVAYLPESDALLVIPDQLAEVIDQDHQALTSAINALNSAQQNQDSQPATNSSTNGNRSATPVATAKNNVMAALGPTLTSAQGSNQIAGLTELLGYRGRKFTYVRSDLIRNHIRRYSLNTDVRNARRYTNEAGQFDADKATRSLAEDFSRGKLKTRATLDLGAFEHSLTDWAADWNATSGEQRDWLSASEHYSATTEAAMLRFFAGASAEATFSETAIGLSAKAQMSVALFEGKATASCHFPSKEGWPMRLDLPTKDGGTQPLDFGAIRATMTIYLMGFAGVKVLLSGNIDISMNGGQPEIRGLSNNEATQKQQNDPHFVPTDVQLNAFTGVSGGCGANGSIEWDNPEARTDDESAFRALAELGGEFQARAGTGFTLGFYVGYEDGKYKIRAKAGAALGVGASGEVVATVGINALIDFVQFVYHQLMKFDFRKLEIIDPLAFEVLHKVISGIFSLGLSFSEGLVGTFNQVSDWWANLKLPYEENTHAHQLAESILTDDEGLLQFAPPESKATMLRTLCATKEAIFHLDNWGLNGFTETREEAIVKILKTITCKREYTEITERMGPDGPLHPSQTGWSAWDGFDIISGSLDGVEARFFYDWRDNLPEMPVKNTNASTAALTAQSGFPIHRQA